MITILSFIRKASLEMQLKIHRSKADFLADRILQCASRSTLLEFANDLVTILDCDIEKMAQITGSLVRCKDQEKILLWLRAYPKIAAAVCFLKQVDFDETIKSLYQGNVSGATRIRGRQQGRKLDIVSSYVGFVQKRQDLESSVYLR